MKPDLSISRRRALKATGGLVGAGILGGAGLTAMTGGALGASVSITASNPDTVRNDRGNVTEVSTDPQFGISWDGFDDAVAKVFFLIEAKVGDGDYHPIYRATPWLPAGTTDDSYTKQVSGTTGEYTMKNPLSEVISQDDRFWDGSGPDETGRRLIVADDDGLPAYTTVDWDAYNPSDYESYVTTGTSMGSAQEAEDELVTNQGLVLQNNFPDIVSGYYGAASDTSTFDNSGDGTTKNTDVTLRYTFELQRPNLSWAKYRTSYDDPTAEEAASELDGFVASDFDDGNSKIAMNGEDGNLDFGSPDGIPYDALQDNSTDHVAIVAETATFTVSAENEPAGVSGDGSTNGGAE